MDKKPLQLSAEERQKAIDNVSPAHLEKLEALQASGTPVDIEWMILSEFALMYGWQAYKDVQNDKISSSELMTLLAAGRKVEAANRFNGIRDRFIANIAVQAKNPSSALKKMTKDLIKEMRVDDE